jgi:hypothetical protein
MSGISITAAAELSTAEAQACFPARLGRLLSAVPVAASSGASMPCPFSIRWAADEAPGLGVAGEGQRRNN